MSQLDETARLFEALRRHAVVSGIELRLIITCDKEGWIINDNDGEAGEPGILGQDRESITAALRAARSTLHVMATKAVKEKTRIAEALNDPELGW